MAKSFSNPTFYNSGKPAFGNVTESDYAGDYIKNKKAKLLYSQNFNVLNYAGVLGSQYNYLLYQRAKVIRNETCASCPELNTFNTGDLVSGLYSTSNLTDVNVVNESTFDDSVCNEFIATDISFNSSPFYWNYTIDPCGSLFGNTACGYNNYEKYRVISKPVIKTAASLADCCKPVCFTVGSVCFTVTDLSYNTYTSGLYTVLQLQNNNPIPPTNLSMIPPLNATGSVTFNHFPTTINYAAVSGGASGDHSVSRLIGPFLGTSIGGLGGTVDQGTITHSNSLGNILSITVGGCGLTGNNYTGNSQRYPGGNTSIYYGAQSIVNISGASGFNSNTIVTPSFPFPPIPGGSGASGTLTSVPSATQIYLGGGGGNGNDGAGGVGGGGAGGADAGPSFSNGLPATANTGGGGGGACVSNDAFGGNGGTGTVYLWWLT